MENNNNQSICVIIPTYKRIDVLKMNLKSFAEQTIKPDRVFVIDDGSSKEDVEEIKTYMNSLDLPAVFLENKPDKGPASARNKGITRSEEDLILFINDDTVPYGKDYLAAHLALARKYPDSSITGPFGRHPEYSNDLLHGRWIDKLGVEASYGSKAGEVLNWQHFCTANVCVPRKFLSDCLFDEDFPYAAHEDTDFGYHLHLKGVPLRYNPDSLVRHIHNYTPEMLVDRQQKIGKSLAYLLKSHPEVAPIFKPRLPRSGAKLVQLFLKSPLKIFLSKDLRLFLSGLTAKYNSFYDNSK